MTGQFATKPFAFLSRLAPVLFGLLLGQPHSSRGGETNESQWVVVTAPAFRSALAPLIAHRRAEGFRVTVVDTASVLSREQIQRGEARPLQALLNGLSRKTPGPNYILLAGAATAPKPETAAQTVVPPLPGSVGRMKDQPGDYGYCLPDKDGAPTTAVGRFPARNPAEMEGMVQKTLHLEEDRQPGGWQNRLMLFTGNPGGGPLAEMLVEPALASRLSRIHPAWTLNAISCTASRYYLPANQVQAAALKAMEAGNLFSVFLLHSTAPAMWLTEDRFLTREDWGGMSIPRGAGVLFTCGCFVCQLAGADGEGYGFAALRNRLGPVAVIGASGASFSAPGQLALDGLMKICSLAPVSRRLADYWLSVQTSLARGEIDAFSFQLLDQIDGSHGKVPLAVQHREHLEMWMLLGDPALRLPVVPLEIVLDVTGTVRAGGWVEIKGALPVRVAGAVIHLTLERPLDSVSADLEKLPPASPSNQTALEMKTAENQRRANAFVLAATDVAPTVNHFNSRLEIPLNFTGTQAVIRAYAITKSDSALGIVTVPILK